LILTFSASANANKTAEASCSFMPGEFQPMTVYCGGSATEQYTGEALEIADE